MQRIHVFILLILAVSSLATRALVFVLLGSQSDPVAAQENELPETGEGATTATTCKP